MKIFKDKVAVITGAGSGIGRALALNLAEQGAKLSVNDVNEDGLTETRYMCEAKGAEVFYSRTDMSSLAEVKVFARATLDHYGYVDMVVNNAGIALGKRKLVDLSYEAWERILGINLWGVIYGTKEFLPSLLERPEAAVVNISSLFGLAGIAEQTPYCTTKFAVRGFTESLRTELQDTNVEVYCVHPGGIKTNITKIPRDEAVDESEIRMLKNFEKGLIHSPEKAAQTILNGVKSKQMKIMIGPETYLADTITKVFPVGYSRMINGIMKNLIEK